MRTYETVVIIDAHQPEEMIEGLIEKIRKIITDNGGSILDVNRWGKRRLAYEIKKKQHGYYVYFLYEVDKKDFPKELERSLRMTEELLRYLVLKIDKKVLEYKLNKKKEFLKENEIETKDPESKAVETKTAESKAVETKTAESEAVEDKTAESEAVETKTAEGEVVETKTAEGEVVENKE